MQYDKVSTSDDNLRVNDMTTQEAIDHFEGVNSLARALGIWPQAIYKWGKYPPEQRQYEIEVKTNGLLRAERSGE